jgi:hypothetical protein
LDQIRPHLHKMVKHKRKIQNTNEPYVWKLSVWH